MRPTRAGALRLWRLPRSRLRLSRRLFTTCRRRRRPEIVYVDRPVLVFSDPVFDFVPPPPIVILAPPPAYLVFPPPPPPDGLFVLPVPVFVPVPVWVNPPAYVAPPPENVIFNNIHNTTIINNNANVIDPGAPGAAGVGAAGVAAGVAAGAAAARSPRKSLCPHPWPARRPIGGQGAPGLKPGQPGPGTPSPGIAGAGDRHAPS